MTKQYINLAALKELAKESISKCRFARTPFLCLSAIYLIAISAIIRANFYYIDDLGRAATGYKGWENFSRYVSNFLSSFIHADNYLTDISPLTQLIAVFLMALSGIIVIWLFSETTTISIWSIIAIIPLGLSPYFLECLSYKYDSPYMALSVFSCLFPFLLRKRGYIIYSIASVLGILLMCTTYQAASGIYPMLVVFLCFRQWNKGENLKDSIKFFTTSVISYALGLLIFKLFIMQPITDYVSNSILPLNRLIPGTIENLYKYFHQVYNDFKKEWILLIVFMGIAYIYVAVRDSSKNKLGAFFMATVTLTISILLCFGIYPMFITPSYSVRAMYGFGCLISFIGVSLAVAKKIFPAKLVCFALSWMFFVFTFTYGNALAEQKRYTDFRVNAVLEDLNNLDICTTDTVKTVQLSGNIGKSPVINNIPGNYKILNRLVPSTFGESWYWNQYYFFHYFGLKNIKKDPSVDLTTLDLPVLQDTMYHRLRGNNQYILIELK